jgi:excisionase family DNA binding protein
MTVLLSKQEVAESMRVGVRTIDRLIATDQTFPRVRVGRRLRIPQAGLSIWIAERMVRTHEALAAA